MEKGTNKGNIFRSLIGIILLFFIVFTYWSINTLETNLRKEALNKNEIAAKIVNIESHIQELKDEIQRSCLKDKIPLQQSSELSKNVPSSQIDPSLPNLLTEDPFYSETLPSILDPDFKPKGKLHTTNLGKPDNLHPFTGWAITSNWILKCIVSISQLQFGIYETFSPNMAIKIEERKIKNSPQTEFWVHLRDKVYWQPLNPAHFAENLKLAPHFLKKHQVTAHDFKFYYDAIMNPHVHEIGAFTMRSILSNVEEIKVIDNLTLVVRFKTANIKEPSGKSVPKIKYADKFALGALRPLPRFVYQYFPDGKKIIENDSNPNAYLTDVAWAQNFSNHWASNVIVSCGPWLFNGMTDQQINFKRNPDYYFPYAVLFDELEISFKNTLDTMWLDFKTGKSDIYTVNITQQLELDQFLHSQEYEMQKEANARLAFGTLDYIPFTYYYIGWNEAIPLFKSKKVRQAMTMAIDRDRIIKEMLNGNAVQTTGPTYPLSGAYDTSIAPWPYDPRMARHLLEEEGWYDSEGKGIIDKVINGKKIPFRFTLTYGLRTPFAQQICEFIATSLKEIGVECHLNGLELADYLASFEEKTAEASFRGWIFNGPLTFPTRLRAIWHSEGAKQKASQNFIGFANPKADAIIEELDYEYDPQKRNTLYHQFHQLIHEEQPYTFLFTPISVLAYRNYVQNVFIPARRQDLIPGANVQEPEISIFWIKE